MPYRPRQAFHVNSLRRREFKPVFKTPPNQPLRFVNADRDPRPFFRAAALRERGKRLRRFRGTGDRQAGLQVERLRSFRSRGAADNPIPLAKSVKFSPATIKNGRRILLKLPAPKTQRDRKSVV